jgi:hypothetical protein
MGIAVNLQYCWHLVLDSADIAWSLLLTQNGACTL